MSRRGRICLEEISTSYGTQPFNKEGVMNLKVLREKLDGVRIP
jgi:hypothetical protein